MKSIIKTALTLSMLLPLAGCFDFGWSKKEKNADKVEKAEVAEHGSADEKASKCSHKGCKLDHTKGSHKKAGHDSVKVQGMDDEDMDEDMDDENIDNVETQDLEDDAEDMEDFN